MRRTGLILLMLCSFWLLTAQTNIEKITVNGDNLIVTRVVIALSQKAEWSYQTDLDRHVVNVSIRNCTPGNPVVEGFKSSALVNGANYEAKGRDVIVKVNVNGPFYIETLKLDNPFKIVLDIFQYKRHYNYQEQLAQAAFYEKSGKYYAAAKQYSQIRRDFPQETDSNYLWAKLLLKQHNYKKATNILNKVTTESKYYDAAQKLLAKLNNKDYTAIEQDTAPPPDTVVCAVTDTVAKQVCLPPVYKPSWKDKVRKGLFYLNRDLIIFPFWAWLLIFLVVLTAFLIILDFKRHHRSIRTRKTHHKVSLIQDDSIKAAMVRKLLENGWNEAEIARELQLDEKEVKLYARQVV